MYKIEISDHKKIQKSPGIRCSFIAEKCIFITAVTRHNTNLQVHLVYMYL